MIEMSKFYEMHKYLKTIENTNTFLKDLTEAESGFFKQATDESGLLKSFEHKYRALFLDIDIDLTKKDRLIKYFAEIKEYFASLNYMHLTLAFSPSDRFFDTLQAILTASVGFPPVFDVTLDPTTIGGVIIDYNGKYLDLSLNKLLEKYFMEHKNAILSGL